MALGTPALRVGISRILASLETGHNALTELDGQLGDGDLGITLLKAFRELDRIKDGLPDDLGQALMQAASAVAKVSSSSYGTLLATSLIAAAKELKGQTEADWTTMPELLRKAREAMSARGKASLGDKTVLDAVAAAEDGASGIDDATEMLAGARRRVGDAIVHFRDQPNRIGRARIFAEKSIGMDDPGMVAFAFMLEALAST